MNEKTYEILRAAINLAKDEQIKRLHTLKLRLAELYPDSDSNINEAIKFWANNTRKPV